MNFQLDTSIPQSYRFGPSPLEQMQSVMTLADLMDKRKMNKIAIEEAERKEAERKKGEAYLQSLSMPTPSKAPAAIAPIAPVLSSPQTGISITSPAQVYEQLNAPAVRQRSTGDVISMLKGQGIGGLTPDMVRSAQGQVVGEAGPLQPMNVEQFAQIPSMVNRQTEYEAYQAEKAAPAPITSPVVPAAPEKRDMYQMLEDEFYDINDKYSKMAQQPGMLEFANSWRKTQLADLTSRSDMLKSFEEAKTKRGTSEKQKSIAVGGLLQAAGWDPSITHTLEDTQAVRDALVTNTGITQSDADYIVSNGIVAKTYMDKALEAQAPLKLKTKEVEAKIKTEEEKAKRQVENEAWDRAYKETDQSIKQQALNLKKQAQFDKRKEKELNKLNVQSTATDAAYENLTEASTLLEDLRKNPTGLMSSLTATLNPYSSAADRRRQFDLVKNKLGFQRLVDLKKGGATFGALSDSEYRNIVNAATTLNFDSSVENNMKALEKISASYKKFIEAVQKEGIRMPAIQSSSPAETEVLDF